MRLFFALPMPGSVRRTLAALKRGDLGSLRWVPEEQLHLTLRFVGEVEEDRLPVLVDAVDPRGWPAFEMRVRGVGLFGSPKRPRVLWAAVEPLAPLAAIAASLEASVQAAGLPPEERPFAAHVTLARFKRSDPDAVARYLREHAALETPPFAPKEVVLYRSTLTNAGSVHEAVARWPVGSDAG